MKIRIVASTVCLLLLLSLSASAQYASRIRPMPALPAACNPLNGDVVQLTTGAGSPGVYQCAATNTWIKIGIAGNQFTLNQGTLTASLPYVSQTATWNNGAVNFDNLLSVVTDTASAAGSNAIRFRLGAIDKFIVRKTGETIITNSLTFMSPAGAFQSNILVSADGKMNVTNTAGTDFTVFSFGPEAVTHPALYVAPAVGGQTQGIVILKGNGTVASFADLGAGALNGAMIYCSDCTIASPCAGGGNGAIAKRLNGAWVCN